MGKERSRKMDGKRRSSNQREYGTEEGKRHSWQVTPVAVSSRGGRLGLVHLLGSRGLREGGRRAGRRRAAALAGLGGSCRLGQRAGQRVEMVP